MSHYQVFIQTYKGNQITDSLKATFVSLDDALAYRDWICTGNSLFVAYIREDLDPAEESILERAKRAYGIAERESEDEEERKRRQRRETMRRYRAKKRAQKQTVVSVCAGEDGNVVFYKEGEE